MDEDDISNDFKQIKVSRLTLGLIMSVAVTSEVVVWNAAQVAGRIGELENSVNRIQTDMNAIQETDPAILVRLDAMEDVLEDLSESVDSADELSDRVETLETWAYVLLTERLDEVEEWIDELDRDSGEELRWELDDLNHRSWAFEEAIRSRSWGDEMLNEYLGR
jgi:DNA repair exonuclease SbcCD ATPase subunit